jgi:hypothetical protein
MVQLVTSSDLRPEAVAQQDHRTFGLVGAGLGHLVGDHRHLVGVAPVVRP